MNSDYRDDDDEEPEKLPEFERYAASAATRSRTKQKAPRQAASTKPYMIRSGTRTTSKAPYSSRSSLEAHHRSTLSPRRPLTRSRNQSIPASSRGSQSGSGADPGNRGSSRKTETVSAELSVPVVYSPKCLRSSLKRAMRFRSSSSSSLVADPILDLSRISARKTATTESGVPAESYSQSPAKKIQPEKDKLHFVLRRSGRTRQPSVLESSPVQDSCAYESVKRNSPQPPNVASVFSIVAVTVESTEDKTSPIKPHVSLADQVAGNRIQGLYSTNRKQNKKVVRPGLGCTSKARIRTISVSPSPNANLLARKSPKSAQTCKTTEEGVTGGEDYVASSEASPSVAQSSRSRKRKASPEERSVQCESAVAVEDSPRASPEDGKESISPMTRPSRQKTNTGKKSIRMKDGRFQPDTPPYGEYKVEQILEYKKENSVDWFKIKWDGYSYEFDSFEPLTELWKNKGIRGRFKMFLKPLGKDVRVTGNSGKVVVYDRLNTFRTSSSPASSPTETILLPCKSTVSQYVASASAIGRSKKTFAMRTTRTAGIVTLSPEKEGGPSAPRTRSQLQRELASASIASTSNSTPSFPVPKTSCSRASLRSVSKAAPVTLGMEHSPSDEPMSESKTPARSEGTQIYSRCRGLRALKLAKERTSVSPINAEDGVEKPNNMNEDDGTHNAEEKNACFDEVEEQSLVGLVSKAEGKSDDEPGHSSDDTVVEESADSSHLEASQECNSAASEAGCYEVMSHLDVDAARKGQVSPPRKWLYHVRLRKNYAVPGQSETFTFQEGEQLFPAALEKYLQRQADQLKAQEGALIRAQEEEEAEAELVKANIDLMCKLCRNPVGFEIVQGMFTNKSEVNWDDSALINVLQAIVEESGILNP